MYTFVIKNNKTDVELSLTRAMLAIAAVAAYVYPNEHYYLSYGLSALLLLFAVFAGNISRKIPSGKLVILLLSGILLYFTSGQVFFPVILFVYGGIIRFLVIDPVITINENGVEIKRNYVTTNNNWSAFNNVILKDGILCLDFKNNKIKYLDIIEQVSEPEFNTFCRQYLEKE